MSLKIKIYNQNAEPVKDLNVSTDVFKVKLNPDLLHQAMVAQMSNSRQVIAHTKDRSEVAGGGKKPWRQKGTGRARAGSNRSPIWVGGGVTFGPRSDRNFKQKINKKMKQQAILMALSNRFENNNLLGIDKLQLEDYKTKDLNKIISNFEGKVLNNQRRDLLIINDAKDEKLKYSGRNLPGIKIINLENINLLDILNYKYLLITETGLEKLNKSYSK